MASDRVRAWPAIVLAAAARVGAQPAEPPHVEQIAVSDPQLVPPTAAPAELRSWDQALTLIRRTPDLVTSIEGVARAQAQRRIVIGAVLPHLDASGAYVHNFNTLPIALGPTTSFVVPSPTVWSATASASWNLLDPRGLYAVGTADLVVDVANLSLADQRRVLAITAVTAMLATLTAGRLSEENRVGLRAALERLALTRTRLEFAQGTDLDLDRALQDVAAARELVLEADEAQRRAREELGRVLGSSTPLGVAADLDLPAFEHAVASSCHVRQDIEERADIAAARTRAVAAQRVVTSAKLLYSPSVALASQATDASVATLGPARTWNFSAVLTVPLFDGGARYGAVRDAQAAAVQAVEALAAARINAMIEVSRASREISVRTGERDVIRNQRDIARRIDERTRQGFATGIGTSLDLVTSAQALRRAEIELILADFRVAQAHADALLVIAECAY